MTCGSIRNGVNFYLPFEDDSIDAVVAEFMQWRSHWLRQERDSLPYNTLDVLLSTQEIHTYPFLEVLLQILATGPITTTTNEHLFSALRYLKTYSRFTTKEIALMDLHCCIFTVILSLILNM